MNEYRIQNIDADEIRTANAVIENNDGAWLAEDDGNEIQFLSDEDGDFIPAPANWRNLVIEG